MLYIPAIFFFILFLYAKKRNGFMNTGTILPLLYCIISVGAILIDVVDAYGHICPRVDIKPGSAFLYCGLLFITMIPFINNSENKIQKVQILKKTFFMDIIVYFYFALFIVLIAMIYNDIIRNLTMLAINDNMKADIAYGNVEYTTLTGWKFNIAQKLRWLSAGSMNVIFIFFYSVCFLKKKKMFYVAAIVGSLSVCISSLLTLDRSRFMYWMLTFILNFVFFYRYMGKNVKKRMMAVGGTVASAILVYVAIINIMRFTDSTDNGANYHLLSYMGQSYLNFCTFNQDFKLDNMFTTMDVMPLYNAISGGMNSLDWYSLTESKSGVFTMCFATFAGMLLIEIGLPLTILWCVVYNRISVWVVRRKKESEITFFRAYLYMTVINAIYLGIFGYYYHEIWLNLTTTLIMIAAYFASKNNERHMVVLTK